MKALKRNEEKILWAHSGMMMMTAPKTCNCTATATAEKGSSSVLRIYTFTAL
jgi:hypothetical protein